MHKHSCAEKSADHEIHNFVLNEKSRLLKVLLKISRTLNSSLSKKFEEAIRNDLPNSYNELQFLPEEQFNATDAENNLFLVDVLSKSTGFFEPLDTKANGFKKFLESEESCYHTNLRLYRDTPERDVEACMFYMRRKISDIIGLVPDPSSLGLPSWGDGSTKSIRGKYTVLDKLIEYPIRSSSSIWKIHSNYMSNYYPLLNHISGINGEAEYCLLGSSYIFDDIARVSMVPKTSKTDRPITVEPTANVVMAKAYGLVLRKRLKRSVGIDLDDQSVNQKLAEKALELDLATVDLSSASDLLSLMLVGNLFPIEWVDLLFKLRLPRYEYNGKTYPLEKFAGMGNAVTFPLETIIFYAASFAACEHLHLPLNNLSVYGDDIIMPSAGVEMLKKLFDFIGFKLNVDKTHYKSEDLFRESCGSQFYAGKNVTPVYLKNIGVSFDASIRNHNRLFRWIVRSGNWSLLPIIGSLRPQNFRHQLLVDIFEDIPETDDFFFVWRGDSCSDLLVKKRKFFQRYGSSDFLWLSLLLLEQKTSSRLRYLYEPEKSAHILWKNKAKSRLKNYVGLCLTQVDNYNLK